MNSLLMRIQIAAILAKIEDIALFLDVQSSWSMGDESCAHYHKSPVVIIVRI